MRENLQKRINNQIPITRHMGIKVKEATSKKVIISAPLSPNCNHQSTVFGGTLASATVICGWCAVLIKFEEWRISGNAVVVNSKIDYLLPVKEDFEAVYVLSDEEKWINFKEKLESRGRAKIDLQCNVYNDDGEKAVRMIATYAAFLNE